MTPADVQELFRNRLGLRLGPSMAEYVLARFKSAGVPSFPVIAADARTGVPLRTSIAANDLSLEASSTRIQPNLTDSIHSTPNP